MEARRAGKKVGITQIWLAHIISFNFNSTLTLIFRLELHLVGGFNDDLKTSHDLSFNIIGKFPNVYCSICLYLGFFTE